MDGPGCAARLISPLDPKPNSQTTKRCNNLVGMGSGSATPLEKSQVADLRINDDRTFSCFMFKQPQFTSNRNSQIHNLAAIHELHVPGPCRANPQLPRKPRPCSKTPSTRQKTWHPHRTTDSRTGPRGPLVKTMGFALVHPSNESDWGNLATTACLGQRAGQ